MFNVMLLFHSVWQSYTIFVNYILQIVDKNSYTDPLKSPEHGLGINMENIWTIPKSLNNCVIEHKQ